MNNCLIHDCARRIIAKGLCSMHYKRQWRHPLYSTWDSMKQRCRNPNNDKYYLYGGRGIVVCDRWLIFENFLQNIGQKPTPKHTLDRINPDGNYEPGNVKWATLSEQNRHLRNNRKNTSGVNGVSWSKERSRWEAHIKVNGRKIFIGRFDDLNEAKSARLEAEKEYWT